MSESVDIKGIPRPPLKYRKGTCHSLNIWFVWQAPFRCFIGGPVNVGFGEPKKHARLVLQKADRHAILRNVWQAPFRISSLVTFVAFGTFQLGFFFLLDGNLRWCVSNHYHIPIWQEKFLYTSSQSILSKPVQKIFSGQREWSQRTGKVRIFSSLTFVLKWVVQSPGTAQARITMARPRSGALAWKLSV